MEIENKYKNGFNSGYLQLRQIDVPEAKEKLLRALGVNNAVSFRNYRYGKVEPKAVQADAVEAVFKEYEITENIWGK